MKKKSAKAPAGEPLKKAPAPPSPPATPAPAVAAPETIATDGLAQRLAELQGTATRAAAESRPDAAMGVSEELLALDDARLRAGDLDTLRRGLVIAETLAPIVPFDRVERLYRKFIAALQAHAAAATSDIFVPLARLADLDAIRRNPADYNVTLDWMLAMAGQLTVTIDTPTAGCFASLMKICENAGQHAAAAVVAIKLANYAFRRPEPNLDLCVTYSIKAADFLLQAKLPDPGIEHLRALVSVMIKFPGFDDGQKLRVLLKLFSLAGQKGDTREARTALECACSVAVQADMSHARLACIAFYDLASFYLAHRIVEGFEDAERLLQIGCTLIAKGEDRGRNEHANYVDLHARIVAARDDPVRAAPICDEAIRLYEQAPDIDAGHFQDFLTFAGVLFLKVGRAPDAVRVFTKALSVFDSAPGKDSRQRAAYLGHLATAHFKTGDYDRAIARYEEAIDLRFA
jgi:tetratricopeptide (TPR) repeat protein